MIDSAFNSSGSSIDSDRTIFASHSILANDAVDVRVDGAGIDETLKIAVAA